jgi:hypothetical protein
LTLGSWFVERHEPFGVELAERYLQEVIAFAVAAQAVPVECAEFANAKARVAHDQKFTLEGTVRGPEALAQPEVDVGLERPRQILRERAETGLRVLRAAARRARAVYGRQLDPPARRRG